MDIIDKLLDLQKQATLERSHYYVASCVTEAIQEIVSLRRRVKLDGRCGCIHSGDCDIDVSVCGDRCPGYEEQV